MMGPRSSEAGFSFLRHRADFVQPMFGPDELAQHASGAILLGRPFESLADWASRTMAEEAAAKVVNLAAYRAKRRPSAPRMTER